MFRHTRERWDRIERLLEKLIEAKPAEAPPSSKLDAAAVLAEAFGKMAGGQADLFSSLGDLAMKGAARRMGIRGGTRRALTAQRQTNGKFMRARKVGERRHGYDPNCGLCVDPATRNVTIPMIQGHKQHEAERAQGDFDFRDPAVEVSNGDSEGSDRGNYQNGSAPTGPA